MTVTIQPTPMPCEVCSPDGEPYAFNEVRYATRWVVIERGSWAGAGRCSGHEFAACETCADYVERKGCQRCYW